MIERVVDASLGTRASATDSANGSRRLEAPLVAAADSFLRMNREQALRARQELASKMAVAGEILRGSLLERTVRHTKECPKCARGGGHQVFVLTVSDAGGRLGKSVFAANGLARFAAGSTIFRS
ncbi:hypothetical protein NLM33_37655 [Bradyrhizobium sp. CCGUVB1N3]|uniref:hypothetical protein n=1 Tax=Bradyrhizobium sp. CCGUVB1N3 TaxID=2949629 RepID=UPI0020B37CBE|nr:hypothetical protein [Bradyrhizobium sp. CCGUVB1N3]MCP3475965.1 hypothetical protein [Bradyrhizobium sp. CCGUVB1N3]